MCSGFPTLELLPCIPDQDMRPSPNRISIAYLFEEGDADADRSQIREDRAP